MNPTASHKQIRINSDAQVAWRREMGPGRLQPALAAAVLFVFWMVMPSRLACAAYTPFATYDFENPNLVLNSELAPHDNWKEETSGFFAPFLKTGVGFNTTQVAEGGSASQGGRVDLYGSRINDGSFSFPNFTYNEGGDTNAVVQADFRYAGVAQLSLAADNVANGTIQYNDSRLGFFGFNGGQFQFEPAGFASVPGTFAVGEWVRLRLLIDWTKNLGFNYLGGSYYNGAATLQYMNLSDGETDFTSVAGLSNVPIGTGESFGSLYNYYSRIYPIGLLMRLDGTSTQLDNIQVGLNVIPEPSSVALLGIGALMVFRRLRR